MGLTCDRRCSITSLSTLVKHQSADEREGHNLDNLSPPRELQEPAMRGIDGDQNIREPSSSSALADPDKMYGLNFEMAKY